MSQAVQRDNRCKQIRALKTGTPNANVYWQFIVDFTVQNFRSPFPDNKLLVAPVTLQFRPNHRALIGCTDHTSHIAQQLENSPDK